MVSSYLFQAGISRHRLPLLADTFLKAERLLGWPNSDNTRDLDDWEDKAIDLAPHGHIVLRRIVKEDPTAYHAIVFAHLRRSSGLPRSRFEREFLKAIEPRAKSVRHSRKAMHFIPDLEFGNGELCITIPQRAHRVEVKINGHIHPLSPGRQLGLPLPWPTRIEWRRHGSDRYRWETIHILDDQQKIFVFDGETGGYKKYIDPTTSSSRQSVRAGPLCLISRTTFEVNEECSHCLGDEAFVLFCNVSTEMIIQRCNLQFNVAVEDRLRLEVFGEAIVRDRKGWLLAGPISVQVHGRNTETSESLEVRLRHPAIRGEHKYPVYSRSNSEQIAKLEMPKDGDFGLACVSLHIRGQDRTLYRTYFWYWPSLKGLLHERLFNASLIPDNLAEKKLLHIRPNSRGQLEIIEGGSYLRARLCFWVERKLVSFTLPPPGASISVRRPDGSEQALRVGASLLVQDDYASNLIVRYSDPMAKIDSKGEIIPTAFGKVGMWRTSFAALKQEGEHNRVRLLPSCESKPSLDLVRIVLETHPSSFRAHQYKDVWFAEAEFESPIDAVRIKAKNLITGEKVDANVSVRSQSDLSDESTLISVIPTISPNRLRIEIPQNNYMDGIWFVRLHVLEHGGKGWLPVINSSGESYATCIAPTDFAQKLVSEDPSVWCSEIQHTQAFLRLSKAIETPIAKPCRPNVSHLALNAWRQLGKLLATRSQADQTSLLNACALPPSTHAPETWIPTYHPVEIAPNLFAIPSEELAILASSEQPEYKEFELVGLAGITESLQDAVDVLDVSITFLTSFTNAYALQGNPAASPGGFNFALYCEWAREMEQIADDDKPLSIWHHDRACYRMADRIEAAQKNPFSSLRLSKAAKIVRSTPGFNYESLNIPDDLGEKFSLVKETPRLMATLTEAWRKGNAEKYWNDLASKANMPVEKTRKRVGTILRLAPELLAFYLLLWVLVEKHERA
ncbi:MAG: hypothetical protein F4065_06270 [Rhodothermaceae bacterium]|nr:hypothetical protein [Rhodothermaceae bacterium]MXZ57666.1 hypothetical protein [Rhodothermaceae bacterium]MYB91326.1 hypothetical protein [Rhodothermaceae bacterium]MYD68767.1 hypothetical protein [Rhodothermaceae bacterium]MYG45421.1 hypothetical protein [Rhodothermaceae bacterium]